MFFFTVWKSNLLVSKIESKDGQNLKLTEDSDSVGVSEFHELIFIAGFDCRQLYVRKVLEKEQRLRRKTICKKVFTTIVRFSVTMRVMKSLLLRYNQGKMFLVYAYCIKGG